MRGGCHTLRGFIDSLRFHLEQNSLRMSHKLQSQAVLAMRGTLSIDAWTLPLKFVARRDPLSRYSQHMTRGCWRRDQQLQERGTLMSRMELQRDFGPFRSVFGGLDGAALQRQLQTGALDLIQLLEHWGWLWHVRHQPSWTSCDMVGKVEPLTSTRLPVCAECWSVKCRWASNYHSNWRTERMWQLKDWAAIWSHKKQNIILWSFKISILLFLSK